MIASPTCPRCGGAVRAPTLWSSNWHCARHGDVPPFRKGPRPNAALLDGLSAQATVPVWLPWPLLPGWSVTGVGQAGDGRTGAVASVVACSGPSPLGGPADLVLVAEQPGVGVGARYAGLPAADPGGCPDSPPDARVVAAGHPTPLWVTGNRSDRTALVGEARGVWLWAVLWPADADVVLLDHVVVQDCRDGMPPSVPFGAPSPYLACPEPGPG